MGKKSLVKVNFGKETNKGIPITNPVTAALADGIDAFIERKGLSSLLETPGGLRILHKRIALK